MSVSRWTRDGAALGVVLPALVFGAALTAVTMMRATGPFEWRLLQLVAWLTVASTLFGAVGGGASGVATAWLDRRAPALAWFVGVPAGLVGGLVAVAALVGWMEYGVGVYRPRAAPFVFPTVAAVTALTAPTHAAYLAIGRRGRSPVVALALAVVLAVTAFPLAWIGGMMLTEQLDRRALLPWW